MFTTLHKKQTNDCGGVMGPTKSKFLQKIEREKMQTLQAIGFLALRWHQWNVQNGKGSSSWEHEA